MSFPISNGRAHGSPQTLPFHKRVMAQPVQVELDTTTKNRFEPAPEGEARIQLLPQWPETWQTLKQEALASAEPLKNLETVADQWAFPSEQAQQNKLSLIPNLKSLKMWFSMKRQARTEAHAENRMFMPERLRLTAAVGRDNAHGLMNRFDEELDALNPETVRKATVDLPVGDLYPAEVEPAHLLRNLAMNASQRGYNYHFHRADSTPPKTIRNIQLGMPEGHQSVVDLGTAMGQAMLLTRHLVDAPANVCTTGYFAKKAEDLTKQSSTLRLEILDEKALKGNHYQNAKKMGLLLAVGQGNTYANMKDYANRQPRLVEMVHTPPNWNPETGKTVVVVGKGIIFDTGGNNLKPTEFMHNMRGDMAGAASVLGLMKALDAKPLSNIRVVGLMPLTENRISGQAMLPQNIYQARSGKTVEITNTDAEGRLVLADAMNYGLEKYSENGQKVHGVFDIATLTGGKARAIGEQNAVGLAGNNPALLQKANQVLTRNLHRQTGTLLMNENYRKAVTQDYGSGGQADAINSGGIANYIRAGIVKAGISDPKKDAETYKDNPAAFRSNPEFMKQVGMAAFGDGASFLQAVGLDSVKRNSRGKVIGENKPNTPWLHFDIAGAEFGKPDARHGGREWATGLGVPDLYLTLQGIAQGQIELEPAKTVVQ
jgi:leucyl aminopeptidase